MFELCKISKLYGSDTWLLRENEMAILRRTERAMVRAVKLMEKKRTEDLRKDAGIEGNSSSDGKSEWSKVVWACVEEG